MLVMRPSLNVGAVYSYTKFFQETCSYALNSVAGKQTRAIDSFMFNGSPDLNSYIAEGIYSPCLPQPNWVSAAKFLIIRKFVAGMNPNARIRIIVLGHNGDPTPINFEFWPYFAFDSANVDLTLNTVSLYMGIIAEDASEKFAGMRWHLDAGTSNPTEWEVHFYYSQSAIPLESSDEVYVKTRPGKALNVLVANSNLPPLVGAN